MKLFLIASSPMRPYIERLIPTSTHQIDVFYLPDACHTDVALLRSQMAAAHGYDAIILADGAGIVPEDGLSAVDTPLILPRVHNCISLLLGSASAYRSLFAHFNGELCWSLPDMDHALHFIPRRDCTCLCYLADTQLALHDNALLARTIAQSNGWDYFNVESDISLLNRLLTGDWSGDDILVVSQNASVFPTYRQDILA